VPAMHDFKYRNGKLWCEGVPLARIARKVGTPVYVYSYATLVAHYRRLDKAFASVPHLICYSVKSNSNIAVCRAMFKEGAGCDVVSGGELRRALRAGAVPEKIVFAGVGKTVEEIAFALKEGVLFLSVESLPELDAIGKVAGRLRKNARVAMRINPDVAARTHRYVSTGKKESKFGMDSETALAAYRKAMRMRYVQPMAVQTHIGSQITEVGPYLKAVRRIKPLVHTLKKMGVPLRYFDIGGGMGIVYKKETPATAARFATAVLPEIEELGLDLVLEPGRFIAGNAGVLLTEVIYMKKGAAKDFVVVDAAMNDLIRPSLYDAYHEIVPLHKTGRRKIVADIVGPVCESGDFFARRRAIPKPRQGEVLAVMGAGAYGFSMSSNYNSRRRAAEVLVQGDTFELVRTRESYDDLVRGERIPSFLR
jgi:diaminopimelate decarboxylase